jgi:hypothetical protein
MGKRNPNWSNKTIMKNYSYRGALMGTMMTCLFLSEYAAGQSRAPDAQLDRVAGRTSAFVRPVRDPARLIIRRIPTLGNNVIVDLYLDGAPFAAIGYGHTYDGILPPGHHVLSVLATPSPKWPTPSRIILNVRSGETYSFTAMGDSSGSLTLRAD